MTSKTRENTSKRRENTSKNGKKNVKKWVSGPVKSLQAMDPHALARRWLKSASESVSYVFVNAVQDLREGLAVGDLLLQRSDSCILWF